MMSRPAEDESRIRLMHGGPFYELMSKIGLHDRWLRSLAFLAFGWLVPLVLLLTTGGGYAAGLFLHDWGALAKFLIAPALLTFAEKPIGFALDECSSILFRTPLIASQSKPDASRALRAAHSRSTAWTAEAVCLAIAFSASALNAAIFLEGAAPGWALLQGNLTLAGIWCICFSNTLYWFLLARLVWRHLVWAGFLRDIAACHLRLAITHPDGHAGLGFIGAYPAGYGLFTFAVSAVAAAGIAHVMERETVTPALFTVICAIWLCVSIVYFVLPLTGLARAIGKLKRRALLFSIGMATDFERAGERAILGSAILDDEAESTTLEVHDVKPIWAASQRTSALLINKSNLLAIVIPALLPLLIAGAFFLPYGQLGPIAKRLLLL